MSAYAPHPGSPAALMVAALQSTGRTMRNAELAEFGGTDPGKVSALLREAVRAGVLTSCLIDIGRGPKQNEYRIGSGIAPVSQGDYKPHKRTVSFGRKPQPLLPPTAIKPSQPAVEQNTGSDPQETTSSPAAVAVAAAPATPAPKSKARELGRAADKVPAGDVIKIYTSIDSDGVLVISTEEAVVELQPDQILALGDFLKSTEPLWRP